MAFNIPSNTSEDVAEVLREIAQDKGVSTDSLLASDIQAAAYAWRIAANERRRDKQMLAVAKVLDQLAALSEDALSYLESIAGPPSATS